MNYDENKPLMKNMPPVLMNLTVDDIEEINSFMEESCRAEMLESTRKLEEKIREKASSLMNKEGLTMEEALSRLQIVFKEGEEPDVVMK